MTKTVLIFIQHKNDTNNIDVTVTTMAYLGPRLHNNRDKINASDRYQLQIPHVKLSLIMALMIIDEQSSSEQTNDYHKIKPDMLLKNYINGYLSVYVRFFTDKSIMT